MRERRNEKHCENKIIYFGFTIELQPLELQCSTIVNSFAILVFYKSRCGGFLGLYTKFCLHMAYDIPNMNALSIISHVKIKEKKKFVL